MCYHGFKDGMIQSYRSIDIHDIFVPNSLTMYRLDTIGYAKILQKSWKTFMLAKNDNEHKYVRIFHVYIPLKRRRVKWNTANPESLCVYDVFITSYS